MDRSVHKLADEQTGLDWRRVTAREGRKTPDRYQRSGVLVREGLRRGSPTNAETAWHNSTAFVQSLLVGTWPLLDNSFSDGRFARYVARCSLSAAIASKANATAARLAVGRPGSGTAVNTTVITKTPSRDALITRNDSKPISYAKRWRGLGKK